MASELTPEAIARLREMAELPVCDRWGVLLTKRTAIALLDAAERCAAAEAQAKAAGELLRAAKESLELVHDLRSYCREAWDWKYGKEWDDQTKSVADRIEAAERAGVKP